MMYTLDQNEICVLIEKTEDGYKDIFGVFTSYKEARFYADRLKAKGRLYELEILILNKPYGLVP